MGKQYFAKVNFRRDDNPLRGLPAIEIYILTTSMLTTFPE